MEIEVNIVRGSKGFWDFVTRLNGFNKTLYIKVEPNVLSQHLYYLFIIYIVFYSSATSKYFL